MAWSLPVLTAVLLGMGVPSAERIDAAPTAQVCQEVVAGKERRPQDCIPHDLIKAAGDYLASRVDERPATLEGSAAWNEFFPRCDRLVRQYAAGFRGRGVDAEDCAQEVWSQLLRTLPNFELHSDRGQFKSWLFAVVRSKANDLLRRKARASAEALNADVEQSLPGDDDGPATVAVRNAQVQEVREALERLRAQVSDTSYQVLYLRHLESMSVSEVAKKLGLSPQQVWARDHRMRRKLFEMMASA